MKKFITFLSIGVLLITVSCQKQIDRPAELPQKNQKKEFSMEAHAANTAAYIRAKAASLNKMSARLLEEAKNRTGMSRKPAPPPIININVPEDYATIQEAVDNAPDGATINVTGSYSENVMISGRSNISIFGNSLTTLTRSPGNSYSIVITNSTSIGIYNFTIVDGPIVVLQSQQITVAGNIISGMGDGIQLLESNNCVIYYNTLSDHYLDELNIESGEGNGILLYNSNNTNINNNLTENNEARGILLMGSSDNTVNSNQSTNDGPAGIAIYGDIETNTGSNSNTLETNEVNGAGAGIDILGPVSGNTLKNNQSHNNNYGIFLDGGIGVASRTKITSCNFSNNAIAGVYLGFNAKSNTVLSTTASNNSEYGFQLDIGSASNTIRSCTATGNGTCDYWDQGTNNKSMQNTFGNICN